MDESYSPTVNSVSTSSTQTEPVAEFSTFIEKLSPLLNEMRDSIDLSDQPAMQKAMDSLETDYNRAKAVIKSQTIQSSPAKQVESLIQNLGRSLGLVLFAGNQEIPLSNKEKIEGLCKEMMNVRFESILDSESDFALEEETESALEEETEDRIEHEIVEEDEATELSIDDIVLQIKYANEENFDKTLLGLQKLIMNDGEVYDEQIIDEGVIKVLCKKLSTSKGNERVIIIRILRYLSQQNDQHKEKMKDLEFLSLLVKSLARDAEEQRETVRLLLNLFDDPGVVRKIGRIRGCVLMLVTISNGNDQEASQGANTLLNSMSSNTQHVLHMAEAGYFSPLVRYLEEGSDMSKVLMATAISRLKLTDQNKDSLGREGAIQPLVVMFNMGNLEAKLSALNALRNLSSSKENIQHVIKSGIVASLLQLLFSVTSVLMTLREPASAILAKVSQCEGMLVKQNIAQQMLSLLSLSSPVIQRHLLEALNNIVSHVSASKLRRKMKESGAIRLIMPFLNEKDEHIRLGALKLVYELSKDTARGEITEQVDYHHVVFLANMFSASILETEKAYSLGILSNLPASDAKIADMLKNSNLLPLMVSETMRSSPENVLLAESIATVLIRFTVPTDKRLQHYSVDNGVIPALVKLLSSGSEKAKRNSALCLSQLSQNSPSLCRSRRLKWLCVPSSSDSYCEVHDGHCSVRSTFCLIKANAITPLMRILESDARDSYEAVLGCVSTLLKDEIWENGCNYLVKASFVPAIIKVLCRGSDLKSQEKAIWILERVFRVKAYGDEFGECAQMVLIDLAQNGDDVLKPSVARLLAQLELLQVQSSYF